MKNIYLTLTVISAIGILLFFGCSKESEQKDNEQQKEYQPSAQDVLIEGKILAFKQKLDYVRENPNLKSGEDDLTIDEAVWNIEALVNYTYADASAEFNTIVNDSASMTVNLIDGKVELNEVVAAYDQIVDILSAKYAQIQSEDKQLMIADISLKSSDESSAMLTVNSGISEGIPNPGGWFGPTDYWFYGNLQGKCDIYYGQGDGSDAAEQIQGKVNMRRSLPVGHRYFTDINEIYFDGLLNEIVFEPNGQDPVICECCDLINPDDPNPNDNYFEKIVFFNDSYFQNFHDCLSPDAPDEMNFYLSKMENLIYDKIYDCFSVQLEDKIFSSCNIWGDLYAPDNVYYFHLGYIYYGISVGSGDPHRDL